MLIPDRLPSLILLVGFWVPPAIIGLAAADFFHRSVARARAALPYLLLMIFALIWAAAWFAFQLDRMPPYIPGSTEDPTFAPPQAVKGLAIVASVLVLPGSAIAGLLLYHLRKRSLSRSTTARQ